MISIDWGSKVITVPQAFLTLISAGSYRLDTNEFRLALRDLEDDEAGISSPLTHNHNTKVSLGGLEYARVIEITNGYTVTFQDVGTPYRVFLNGSNNNILDVTNLNNVSVAPNNSAGLVQMAEIEKNMFNNAITIDQLNGSSGTLYPSGTSLKPVNNIPEANQIAASRGITTFNIVGDLVLGAGDNVENKLLIGENALRSMILINPAAQTLGVEIQNAAVTGTLDGTTILRACYVFDLEYVSGFIFQCQLSGTITIGGVMSANFLNSYSDSNSVTVDMGGAGQSLNCGAWYGDMHVANKTGTDSVYIHSSAATIYITPTVTNGTGIHIGGTGRVINQSSIEPEIVYMNSPDSISDATLAAAANSPIHSDTKRMNGAAVLGDGTSLNKWRGA